MSEPAWMESIARLDSIRAGVDAMQVRIEELKLENEGLREALNVLVAATGQIGLLDNHVEDARRAAMDVLAKVGAP